jgi:drug/metabolite transporter (DMT)-like permease
VKTNDATDEPHPLRSILLIMLTVAMFAWLDSIAKYLGRFYPVPVVVWARYAFHLLFMLLIFGPRMRGQLLQTHRPGLQIVRGLLLVTSSLFFFSGLKYMPLAETSSITFIGPILVTLGASILLKERVDPARWVAVIAGFVGVLIIIRPGGAVFSPVALLPLCTAVSMAAFTLITRQMSGTEDPITTLFFSALVGTLVISLMLPFGWKAPESLFHVGLMAAMGLIGGVSHLVLIKAYEGASASRLAPYSYTQLVWTLSLGYLIFGDFPDGWSLVGIMVIVASAIYIATHQHLAGRETAQAGSGK